LFIYYYIVHYLLCCIFYIDVIYIYIYIYISISNNIEDREHSFLRVRKHVVCHSIFINFIKLKINLFPQVTASDLVCIKENKTRVCGETVSEECKTFRARMNKLNKTLSLLGRSPRRYRANLIHDEYTAVLIDQLLRVRLQLAASIADVSIRSSLAISGGGIYCIPRERRASACITAIARSWTLANARRITFRDHEGKRGRDAAHLYSPKRISRKLRRSSFSTSLPFIGIAPRLPPFPLASPLRPEKNQRVEAILVYAIRVA